MPAEQNLPVRLEIGHVLFIDIVGYSKLLITEQSEQLQELREVVRATRQFQLAEADGKLLRLPTGDGAALVFRDSPEAPALCALEIAESLKNHPKLRVRMGIHSGPVNEITDLNEQANIAGAGIDIAQRVMDCGDAGHILLSKHVADDLEHYPQWRSCLHDLGECEVKHGLRLHLINLYTEKAGNPARPQKFNRFGARIFRWTRAKTARRNWNIGIVTAAFILAIITALLFRLNRSRIAEPHTTPALPLLASVAEKGIAVLPFENLSRDQENAYLADGIQEEILTRLAKVSDLKVISRTSASKFRSSPDNLREIAAQLGVANVLEGSVQKSADQVRVNVQLINATTDAHLWADTYDRKLTDVFAIESEIAKAITDKLKAKLTGREEQAISIRPTANSEAHQLYLKGRYFWNKRTSDGLRAAITYFNQAIDKDPAYGPAYAGLADAYAVLPNYSQTPAKEAFTKAEAAALKALELDDDLAEAHISLGNIRLWHKWGNGAEAEFKRGLQLNPNYSTGHQWYSIYLSVTGRLDESIAEMEKAKELDPFSIIINTETGCPYLYAKQYDRATECFTKAVEMEPDFPFAHFALGEAYDRTGRYKEALAEHEKALELARRGHAIDMTANAAPKAWYALTGPLQNAHRALGPPDYWQGRLQSAKKLYEQGILSATEVAGIYSVLGDREQALSWLAKAYDQGDDFLVFLNIQPQFEALRSEPRFQALVQNVLHSSPPSVAPGSSRVDKSIAVLPFQNLSANQENAFFTDGVQGEILTHLARVADLKVISQTSVMQYKNTPKRNLREIAYALGVAHILEGSVQRAANRVRVNAQLIDARNDAHIWAETYDRDLADVFAIQSEIARKIADQLQARLSPQEKAVIQERPTKDLAAYDLYLRATEIWRSLSTSSASGGAAQMAEVIRLLDTAVARDPTFMPALGLLARAHLFLYWQNADPIAGHLDFASKALEAAARLQPDAGEVHLTRALYYYHGSRNYEPALAELVLAKQTLPNDPNIPYYTAVIERRQDKWEASTRHIKEALQLDPRNVQFISELAGTNYWVLRRYADAVKVLNDALAWKPNDFGLGFLAAYIEMGWKADLRRWKKLVSGESAKNADPNDLINARLGLALRERDYQSAEQILAAPGGNEFDDDGFFTPREWNQGIVARGLGDNVKANASFEAARTRAAAAVRERPGDAKALMVLGQLDAALQHKDEAITEGQQASELLPAEKDVLNGTQLLVKLSGIYAQVGETDRALDLLERVISKPDGSNYGSLTLDEVWDPLRGSTRFKKIVASLAPKE